MGEALVQVLRLLASALEIPALLALFVAGGVLLFDLGLLIGELTGGLHRMSERWGPVAIEQIAKVRVARADMLTRLGPMLGLMGTLIPLGPGLAALGRGDVQLLARSVTVAFDTTVLGIAIGALAFGIAHVRRRRFGALLDRLERA
ncbi:MAG: MotA/TolQ/ExbB proton channel family protein [Myxococcota bacterium]